MRASVLTEAVFLVGLAGLLSACASLPNLTQARDSLSPAEHTKLAESYAGQGDAVAAAEQLKLALDQDPHNFNALMDMGSLAFAAQNWKDAEHYFHRAVKTEPDNAGALNDLAMCYLAQNEKMPAARAAVDKGLGTAGVLKPYLLDTSAQIAIRQKRWQDAKAALIEAQRLAPPDSPEFATHLRHTRLQLVQAYQASQTKPN